jgi:hypothetical protein
MRFVEVTEIPAKVERGGRKKGEMIYRLRKFMDSDVKIVKIEFTLEDYIGPASCYQSYRQAIKRHVLPIDVKIRNGDVYLIRRDI